MDFSRELWLGARLPELGLVAAPLELSPVDEVPAVPAEDDAPLPPAPAGELGATGVDGLVSAPAEGGVLPVPAGELVDWAVGFDVGALGLPDADEELPPAAVTAPPPDCAE